MALPDMLFLLFLAHMLPNISPVVKTASIIDYASENEDYVIQDGYHAPSTESPDTHISHDAIHFLLNTPNACDAEPFLVIVVCSNVMNFDRRIAIRETWGSIASDHHSRTVVLFIVGLPTEDTENVQTVLQKESTRYQDIVQVDFSDTYRNLSLKSVSYLHWLDAYCKEVKYVLKTDDDMFINVPVLLHDLQNTVHERFLMGNIIAGAQPMRDRQSKWFTPESLYSGRWYPTYMSGTGYVISGDVIHDLVKASQKLELFWLEDIYITGLCARKAKLTHIFNGKFGYKQRSLDPCYLRMVITAHEVNIAELREIWKAVNLDTLDCDQGGPGLISAS